MPLCDAKTNAFKCDICDYVSSMQNTTHNFFTLKLGLRDSECNYGIDWIGTIV